MTETNTFTAIIKQFFAHREKVNVQFVGVFSTWEKALDALETTVVKMGEFFCSQRQKINKEDGLDFIEWIILETVIDEDGVDAGFMILDD